MVLHTPVHRQEKFKVYTSQNLLTTHTQSSIFFTLTVAFKTCISLVELCAIVATDLQAVVLVSNEIARNVDTLICIIILEKFVFMLKSVPAILSKV